MRKTLLFLSVVGLSLFGAASVSPAFAEDPKLIGEYGAWSAYVWIEDGSKICYMASKPEKEEGNYSRRGEIFALVTHRPSEGTNNVFSYSTGYDYKVNSDATLKIDGDRYTLVTHEETAWASNTVMDDKIAKSIQRGSKMIVKGTSKRGTLTTDTYSLRGSSAAHKAISDACGIR